jgi:hypothetical protein
MALQGIVADNVKTEKNKTGSITLLLPTSVGMKITVKRFVSPQPISNGYEMRRPHLAISFQNG